MRSWHFVRLASRVTSVAGNTGADTAGSTVAVDSTAGRCTAGCREGCCTAARCTAGRIAVAGSTVAVGSTAEEGCTVGSTAVPTAGRKKVLRQPSDKREVDILVGQVAEPQHFRTRQETYNKVQEYGASF